MKRRFANRVSGDYSQKRLNTEYFNGYITHIKMNNIDNPIVVNNGIYDLCIIDNNYEWYGVYPDNGKYAITIMFDDKGNIIQWYFDIAKEIGLENGIPYEDDLYLDMIITKEHQKIVADEQELLEAKLNGKITQNDVEDAYNTLHEIEEKYFNRLEDFIEFTKMIQSLF